MPRTPLSADEFRATVVAAPPLAMTAEHRVAVDANVALLRHIATGGIGIVLYGENANLYHFTQAQYAEAVEMMTGAQADLRIIPAIGPDLGKMLDQAALIERSGLRDVALLPIYGPSDTHGTADGVRRIVDRLGFPVIVDLSRENYIRPVTLVKLFDEGAVSFVKYSVARRDPADDPYLDAVIKIAGKERLLGGLGETAAFDHIHRRQLPTVVSGAAAIAPAAVVHLLEALRAGDAGLARRLLVPFHEFDRIRRMHGATQVLHNAVSATGIAATGPLIPMLSSVKAHFMDEVREAAKALSCMAV